MDRISFEILAPGHPDRGSAAAIALRAVTPGDRCGALEKVSPSEGTTGSDGLNPMIVARDAHGDIVAAFSAAVTPGRMALLFCGGRRSALLNATLTGTLLERLQSAVWQRGVLMLQCNIPPEDAVTPVALQSGGLDHSARLVYLECDAFGRKPGMGRTPAIEFVRYSPEREGDFLKVLRGTYRASLDCPALNDLRDVGDVLTGHRYTGVHDPDLWFVALRDRRPVGVLLLSGVSGRSCYEVVYVGVVDDLRGRGFGDRLMGLAVETARRRGVKRLLLAVDEKNHFARSLYARWGFNELERRDVWIATNRLR